jgi:hypothetical protein
MRLGLVGHQQDISMLIVSAVKRFHLTRSGTETEYQDLAYSGRPIWEEWNSTIAKTPADELPKGLTPETKVFEDCGLLRLSEGKLSQYDLDSLKALESAGYRDHQHHIVSVPPSLFHRLRPGQRSRPRTTEEDRFAQQQLDEEAWTFPRPC